MCKVRVGMVGSGFISNIHLDAYQKTGKMAEVVAVASTSMVEQFAEQHGIAKYYNDYRYLLDDPDIDVIDVCVPNVLHEQVCLDAALAGKHIICEKPLTGYFGNGATDELVGHISKAVMYRQAMLSTDKIIAAVKKSGVKFCYAEDFVYAPPAVKAKKLMTAAGGTVLEIRSEESHSGSHAAYSREWRYSGGGSLLRMGAHPIGLAIHLKNYEGLLKYGKPIRVCSIVAEVGTLTQTEAFRQEEKHWMVADWKDVEDWSAAILTFDDGTKGIVYSNDITLGGVVNTLDILMSNGVIRCNMAANDACKAYAPSPDIFGDEYISEKIETKAGWTFPSPDEDWMRGYPAEMQDFAEAIYFDREPVSGIDLARQVVQAVYASYLSAELGRRVDLEELEKQRAIDKEVIQ